MESFIGLAKQGYEAYSKSHSEVSQTGGSHYNSPHHSQQDGPPHVYTPDLDHDEVVQHAHREGSGESSLFSSAMSFLSQNKSEHHVPIDEEHVQQAHKAAYEEGGAKDMSSGGLGSAAAMQAFKMFTSGGGGSKNKLVSMAMSEASKLFDKSGGSGNKQEAVNGAAMTVMKMMVQSKMSSMIGGGDSGGLGGLMGMASKFL